ncbi:MAG: bifunctional DNA-binding transcriptional regulator/O6-methylguanine-DNA methyltransferase Ada [Planctomycetes bacterium]|nr:bifunctional DNA-binding transcriptional regulator/O6-methylguanine-DNA methyltransferase Ada [Planctomycetota bacterium]
MKATRKRPIQRQRAFRTDDQRWRAVVERDPAADGAFYYSVSTTGVYCRPNCAARLPLRKNVTFHDTPQAARAAGFRPCRRCRPDEASLAELQAALVAKVCRYIEAAESVPSLSELAEVAEMSTYHLHRLFKAQTGITPRQYAAAQRVKRLRDELSQRPTVAAAIYGAGYSSNSRLYESSAATLGMTPTAFRERGKNTTIRFAVGQCWLGAILVAATPRGICAILIGDDADALTRDLQNRFQGAELVGGDAEFETWVARVVGFVDDPSRGLALPLDIRGTAFQQQVWEALRAIPIGTTVSYTEVARKIGHPNGVRAVAGACAANALAVAIPCHRVVRTDGSLSGYRWGIDRKRALLLREQDVAARNAPRRS